MSHEEWHGVIVVLFIGILIVQSVILGVVISE